MKLPIYWRCLNRLPVAYWGNSCSFWLHHIWGCWRHMTWSWTVGGRIRFPLFPQRRWQLGEGCQRSSWFASPPSAVRCLWEGESVGESEWRAGTAGSCCAAWPLGIRSAAPCGFGVWAWGSCWGEQGHSSADCSTEAQLCPAGIGHRSTALPSKWEAKLATLQENFLLPLWWFKCKTSSQFCRNWALTLFSTRANNSPNLNHLIHFISFSCKINQVAWFPVAWLWSLNYMPSQTYESEYPMIGKPSGSRELCVFLTFLLSCGIKHSLFWIESKSYIFSS